MPKKRLPRITLPKLTDRLLLGNSGLGVSPFCLGMVKSSDTVCAAFERGINFFFISADLHWPAYETARCGIERLLARDPNVREQVVIGLVTYVTQPEFCAGALLEGLTAVSGLKSIDVAIIGGAYSEEFMTRLHVFNELRREGYLGIKAIGTTFHDRTVACLAVNHSLVDIAFIRYNSRHTGAAQDLFPNLQQPSSTLLFNFKSTLGFVPSDRYSVLRLNDDYWQPDITDHYRFVLTKAEIDGLLCSPATPAEVEALQSALDEGPLDDEEEKYLIDLATLDDGRGLLLQEEELYT